MHSINNSSSITYIDICIQQTVKLWHTCKSNTIVVCSIGSVLQLETLLVIYILYVTNILHILETFILTETESDDEKLTVFVTCIISKLPCIIRQCTIIT